MEASTYKLGPKMWEDIEGPWNDEPDRLHWVDEDTGLDCLIVRNHHGALCGYVGVPEGHPWYEVHYDDMDIDVHGGLTYSDGCIGHICDSQEKGDEVAHEEVWWLGFDCAHAFDLNPMTVAMEAAGILPKLDAHDRLPAITYKDIDYVKAECRDLAAQIASAA